jgi:signal transduction histidine kinase
MAASPPHANPVQPATPATGSSPSIWHKLLEAAFLFLPKQLEDARKRGLLWVLAVAGFTLFVLPPLVVLMTGVSLTLLEKLEWNVATDLRKRYVAFIYSSFDIERRAGNVDRIDYFQSIDFVTPPNKPSKYTINLVPGQRAMVSLSTVRLYVTSPKCALKHEEERPELLVLRLNEIEVAKLKENDDATQPKTARIDHDFWSKHLQSFSRDQTSFVLEFVPTAYVQKQCAHLAVRGSVTVFKDMFNAKEPGAK